MVLDDSVFEFALYDVLNAQAAREGAVLELDALRNAWRATALRHSDLPNALSLLVAAGSLEPRGETCWQLTASGAERAAEVGATRPATMEDQVARSVIKMLRDRVPSAGLAPRSGGYRRRSRDRTPAIGRSPR